MKIQSLLRVLTGCTIFLFACSTDSSQSATAEGRQLLSQEVQKTFDELARPAGACLSGRLGNEKSCETSAAWKQYLTQACGARDLLLVRSAPGESCGSDQFRSAEFSCCPMSAPALDPKCVSLAEGGPSVCKSSTDWKQLIAGACQEQGLRVGEAFFGESCGADAARSVSYTCCGDQPQPTAAAECQSFSDGGPGICRTPEDWKVAVTAQCKSKGLGLGDLSLSGACGSGSFSATTFLCCGAPATPPPAPLCQSAVYDKPGCRDEATWRSVATDLCQTQSLKLTAIAFSDSCSAGVWQNMKYECCPPTTDPPPPPPSSCATQILDEGGACNDQATWRDRAVRACAAAASAVKDLTFGTPCGVDKYLQAKVSCCP